MVELIPFIPKGTKGVDESTWQYALKIWLSQLTLLLNASNDDFKQQLSKDEQHLFDFCTKVFSHVLNTNQQVDIRLLENLFLIFMRMSTFETINYKLLTSSELLCSFALIYGEANPKQVRQFFSRLVTQESKLEQAILNTLESLEHSVTDLYGQLKQQTNNRAELLYRAHVNVRVFSVLFMATLELPQSTSLFEDLDMVLVGLYQQINPILKKDVEQDESLAPLAFLLKQSIVQCYNTWFDLMIFRPLGFISDTSDHQSLVKEESTNINGSNNNKDDIIDLLSEKLLFHIESSNLTPCSAFVDGPLVMDWQVEYDISNKLDFLNSQLFNNEDDRIEFLKLSMEQVRDTNQGTGHWGDTLQKPSLNDIQEVTHYVEDDLEMTSKISQVHDLLPDLGGGFIEAMLKANQGDVELVIMQLLEDNLPESVAGLDRKLERRSRNKPARTMENDYNVHQETESEEEYVQESVLSSRRNIYDNDEFDVFANRQLDHSKVYVGKKEKGTADTLLKESGFTEEQKRNIIQLADMYDDDYDDTYDDINDASGGLEAVDDGDSAIDIVRIKKEKEMENELAIQNESVLVHTFIEDPDLFGRSSLIRKSRKRAELRKKTNMTDEQLVGWAIMFNRNPRKQKILDKYMLFTGQQDEIPEDQPKKSSNKNNNNNNKNSNNSGKKPDNKNNNNNKKTDNKPNNNNNNNNSNSNSNNSDNNTNKKPSSEARNRDYKDKNKARIGNHNRKAMRDRKVAKAGALPTD